ncbi:hypothetical protein SSX86_028618 [Deinandra increscens subsp. villosa]|uniref:F-box domain-containing protein n=1 Tax=Deinandra increscens subsp. villosa TaxID=3103831 RepID=A0AAP0GLJ2_9ASTR
MSDYFPRDLQLQILKRLLLHSILTCRSVCKSWNSLLTTHDFISAHLKFAESSTNHPGIQSLFIRYFDRTRRIEQYVTGKDDETFGLHFSNIEFPYTSAYFTVIGYCDGVVCLTDDVLDPMYHHMVTLWNPSIRKTVRVVTVPNCDQTRRDQGTTVLGFGVCPRTHDPKVIRIMYYKDIQNSPSVEVFSLASNAWRKPRGGNLNRPRKTIRISWSQVCLNGFVHWVVCDKQIETSPRCLIMSFDLARELFDEMSLPDALVCEDISNLAMSSRKGQLTVLEYDMGKGKECCGVWVMNGFGVAGSWERLYVIRLPGVLRKAVGFRMNGEIVLALKNHELVYVECTGSVKSLGIYGSIRSFFLGSYVESLILINQ